MIKSIVLDETGVTLLVESSSVEEDNLLSWEDNKKIIGVHEFCEGRMYIIKTSTKYRTIVCKECFFRLMIPSGIKTYRELRENVS